LAELIDGAENGSTEVARSKAQKQATETIIKIWEHRASLPGKAYPLAPYKEVLKVLNRLRPTENPFPYFERHDESKKDKISADLFDILSRLIIALLLMKVSPEQRHITVDVAAIESLDEMELHVWTVLLQWGELFQTTDTSIKRKRMKKKDETDSFQVDLEEVAIRLIDNMSTILTELRSEFKNKN